MFLHRFSCLVNCCNLPRSLYMCKYICMYVFEQTHSNSFLFPSLAEAWMIHEDVSRLATLNQWISSITKIETAMLMIGDFLRRCYLETCFTTFGTDSQQHTVHSFLLKLWTCSTAAAKKNNTIAEFVQTTRGGAIMLMDARYPLCNDAAHWEFAIFW